MQFHADTLVLLLQIFSHESLTCSCVLVLPLSRSEKAERQDKGHWYSEPASQPARPIQSTGTPAGIHTDSLHHGQGHKIFQRGGSKHTVVKKANQFWTHLMLSTSFLNTHTHAHTIMHSHSPADRSSFFYCAAKVGCFLQKMHHFNHMLHVQTCSSTVITEKWFDEWND